MSRVTNRYARMLDVGPPLSAKLPSVLRPSKSVLISQALGMVAAAFSFQLVQQNIGTFIESVSPFLAACVVSASGLAIYAVVSIISADMTGRGLDRRRRTLRFAIEYAGRDRRVWYLISSLAAPALLITGVADLICRYHRPGGADSDIDFAFTSSVCLLGVALGWQLRSFIGMWSYVRLKSAGQSWAAFDIKYAGILLYIGGLALCAFAIGSDTAFALLIGKSLGLAGRSALDWIGRRHFSRSGRIEVFPSIALARIIQPLGRRVRSNAGAMSSAQTHQMAMLGSCVETWAWRGEADDLGTTLEKCYFTRDFARMRSRVEAFDVGSMSDRAVYFYTRMLHDVGEYEIALDLLESRTGHAKNDVIERPSVNPYLLLNHAILLGANSRYSEAVNELDVLVRDHSCSRALALRALYSVLNTGREAVPLGLSDIGNARILLAEKLHVSDLEIERELAMYADIEGYLLYKIDLHDSAATILERCAEVHSWYAWPCFHMGLVQMKRGVHAKAVFYFGEAIRRQAVLGATRSKCYSLSNQYLESYERNSSGLIASMISSG